MTELRIERARLAMNEPSVQIFDLLPVLLHYNHPALPGYLDQQVPQGIAHFVATDVQQQFVNNCARTAKMPIDPIVVADADCPITGLYAMGSTSSMGQSLTSDLDIWVCIPTSLNCQSREILDSKCSLVSQWAME